MSTLDSDIGIETIARRTVNAVALRKFSQINNALAAIFIVGQWTVIGLAAFAAIVSQQAFVAIISVIVIASRQHALGVLMHDACHYRLFSRARLNDLLSDIFCAVPCGLITSRYRVQHLKHHVVPNAKDDPYFLIFQANPKHWLWPKRHKQAWAVIACDLFLINLPTFLSEIRIWSPFVPATRDGRVPPLSVREIVTVVSFYSAIFGLLLITGLWGWFFVLWILPSITVLPVMIRLRTIAEHHNLPEISGTVATRNIYAAGLEAALVSPLNINLHLTHHLFPSVPQYHLPKLTAFLKQDATFERRAHSARSYFGLNGAMRELIVSQSDA